MTGTDLIMGMESLDDALIDEAEMKYIKKRSPSHILWCCSAAACIGLLFIAAAILGSITVVPPGGNSSAPFDVAILSPTNAPGQDAAGSLTAGQPDSAQQDPADSSGQNIPDSLTTVPPDSALPAIPPDNNTAALSLDMAKINVNELSDYPLEDVRILPQYEATIWDWEDILSYYGKDLVPAYIPADLTASPGNGTARVYIQEDGTVDEDSVYLSFYHDFNEDGYPVYNEAMVQSISLTASRKGILTCAIYVFENEMELSEIVGTPVLIGYRSMTYGPYDPETHEPSGYYDLYVAEFEYDGIEYEIITKRIKLEELAKVAASIITNNDQFELTGNIPQGICTYPPVTN